MSIIPADQRYSCNICGVVRSPSNHWFMAWERYDCITIRIWDAGDCADPEMKHLCGESCAATHLTRYLASLKERSEA